MAASSSAAISGVQIQPVNQDIAEGLGLTDARGAMVDQTMPGTPAAAAGLKPAT